MKVAFYTNEFPPHIYGGAGVAVEYLSRALSRLADVEVRCFGDQDLREERLSAKGYSPWKRVSEGAHPGFGKALEAMSINLDFCKNNTADVVHCHTWYSMLGGHFTKILHKIPLVVTTHSLEPLRPWKREQLGNAYDLSSWIEKTALDAADAVIAVSEETKRDILRCYGLPEEKVRIIHNGIDISEYGPGKPDRSLESKGVDLSRPYALFVGRITRQKGIIHLVEAVRHLPKGTQVVLCAGAPDTPELAAEMGARVAAARAAGGDIVWIEEMLPKKELIGLYGGAAVFCCPSVYEPFGLINLEAMACGTPVVASSVGGIREVVVHEETGLLVPFEPLGGGSFEPKDPDAFARDLAAGITRVLEDPALRERFSAAGRERVEARFSWDSIAEKTFDLYKSLL